MNIKGIHISVDGLRINPEISSILDKYNIVTYADLNREIEARNKEIFENYFLVEANCEFNKLFDKQKDAEVVYNNYLKMQNESKKINLVSNDIDSMVKLCDLPIFKLSDALAWHFVNGMFKNYKPEIDCKELDKYTIEYVKNKMKEIIIKFDGEAVPYVIHRRNGIGVEKYNNILASLNFYDRYIETLLENYSNIKDAFYYKKNEKLFLVKRHRKEIFNYLNDVGYELIIGDVKKVMPYLDVEFSRAKYMEPLYKKEEIIANYVTFDEALNITEPKVLNKFIVPYGKR